MRFKVFECAARRQGTVGGNNPVDCNWPFCGCDEYATKVLESLQECGWGPATETGVKVQALDKDNRNLTRALQSIERGVPNPKKIAADALDLPAHKALYQ